MKKWLEMQMVFENEGVDVKTRLLLLLHELTNIHVRLADFERSLGNANRNTHELNKRLTDLEDRERGIEECSHEWHADQDNDCNTCVKCGARQEIYTE